MRSSRLEYIPALDGLRGAAVAGVLLFHSHRLSGGFLGVDLFFTLSGFLITSLLIAEWRTEGSIDLLAFWARRARRLLPALFLLLALTVFYAVAFARVRELARLRGDALATLLYVANWWQIQHGLSYWDIFTSARPLAHTWSLAIEEQFYLVWPLLFLGAAKVAGRRARAGVAAMAALLTGTSVALMVWLQRTGSDATRLYEGSDTRAASILVGALAAALVARPGFAAAGPSRRILETVGLCAGALLAWSWFTLDGLRTDDLFRGGLFLHSIGSAALITAAATPTSPLLGRALAFGPLRLLGVISYGVYLFHLPLFVILTPERIHIDGWRLDAIRLVATLVVAGLSYRLLERPIRQGALQPRRAVTAFAASTAALVLVIVVSTSESWRMATNAGAASSAQLPPSDQLTARRVMIVGDSVGWTIGVGLDAIKEARALSVQNNGRVGCGIGRADGIVRLKDGELAYEQLGCVQWQEIWTKSATEFRPDDVVLVVGGWDAADHQREGAWTHPCAPGYDEWWRGQLRTALQVLATTNARVHLTTAPLLRTDKLGLSEAESDRRIDCLNSSIRIVGAVQRVNLIDLAEWVCPNRVCVTTVDGSLLRPDGMHFDDAGGPIVAAWLLDELGAPPE